MVHFCQWNIAVRLPGGPVACGGRESPAATADDPLSQQLHFEIQLNKG